MKKIKFTCSSCDAKLRVPSHLAGVSAPCPKCGATITAPKDLDHVVDEAPRQMSSSGSKAKPAMRTQTQSLEPHAVAGSLLPATAALDPVPKQETRQEASTPVSRSQAPARPDIAPVLPEPVPANEEPPVPNLVSTPPEPSLAISETIPKPEDSEPELIVTEEVNLKVPEPQPVPPPSVPPTLPDLEEPPSVETRAPVPKTQPIRVISRSESLPERREEDAPEDLPRLDVNLAEGMEDSQFSSTPGIQENAPTKVQLPQVGSQSEFHPGDFFGPETSSEESYPDSIDSSSSDDSSATSSIPVPDFPETPFPVSEQEESSVIPRPTLEQNDFHTSAEWPEQEDITSPVVPEVSLDEIPAPSLGEEIASDIPATEQSYLESLVPEESSEMEPTGLPFGDTLDSEFIDPPHAPQEDDLVPQSSLHEGSFENLLSQNMGSDQPPSFDDSNSQSQVVSPDFPFDSTDSSPITSPIAPERPEQMPARTDADVLDEMFGNSSSPRMKKSTVVMLSVITAVIIIAVVFVLIIGKALGGFNPTIAERAQNNITPPPFTSIEDNTTGGSAASGNDDTGINEAPPVIDPKARTPIEANPSGNSPTTIGSGSNNPGSSSGTGTPDRISPPPISDPANLGSGETRIGAENPDIAFPRNPDSTGGSAAESTGSNLNPETRNNPGTSSGESMVAAIENGSSRNYNPPAFFPAPDGSESSPLGKTHDLLDAFLRAPNWEAQIPYIYQGESLRPTIEEYYKKYSFTTFDRFSLQLFQLEEDTEMGGPYWVYLVSTSDTDQGYPVIVRVEDGNLKVDWEIYSEFQDRHFAQFLKGSIASPHTFRVVIERVSDYYGPDRNEFSDLKDYLVYQINPPYGDLGEFSEYAFVKKDSEVAKRLDAVVGLGEEALAVIVTLEQKRFDHGVTHEVISEYVTEGWFR